MAARTQHVQDNSVSERRLRPIYEWLDGGYNKVALQEADKVLRKTPKLQCAKALKALALLRLGRESECTALLDILTEEKPYDDSTLQVMTICYRELQQYDKVCILYEQAVKQDPSNEEMHAHLFMSYVRVLDYKSQQQSAMQLYKLKPKNPYYFWVVMSIVLQASRTNAHDPAKKKVLLTLAERMVDKLINENRIEAEQEVQLYMMILKLQEKDEEALKLLEDPLGSRLLTGASTHAKIPFLIKLNKWSQLNVLCKKMLIESPDLWDIWQHYLSSAFKINTSAVNNTENNDCENHVEDDLLPDDTVEKCHDFIVTLMESCSSSGSLTVRSPWLARLELFIHLQNRKLNPRELLGDYLELLVEYFRKFGHKPCCFFDMKLFLKNLPVERRADLASRLLKDVGISSAVLPQSEQQMQRHICALQISHMCGTHNNLNNAHLIAFVTALALHYQHGFSTYGADLLPTDSCPSDPYALLSAHVLYDLALRENSSTPLILALTLLENLIKTRPCNHHAKLLCLKLYHCLGAGTAAHQIYESLDVKHMQLDSMGYAHCALLAVCGPPCVAQNLYTNTCRYFTINYKDTADHLTFSYKFGSFLKLEEFLDFRERLNNSLHKSIITTEKVFIELVQNHSLQSIKNLDFFLKNETTDYNNLRDNRDLTLYVSYDPETLTNIVEKENNESFVQDKRLLELRMALLHYIGSALEIANCTNKTQVVILEKLKETEEKYKNIYMNIKSSNYTPIHLNRITGHFPSRLHQQIISPYYEVLGSLINVLKTVVKSDTDSVIKALATSEEEFKKMCDNVCNLISQHRLEEDHYLNKRKNLEIVLNAFEIINISTLLCAVSYDLLKPSLGGRKNKKKNSISAGSSTYNQFLILITTMKTCMESFIQNIQVWWSPAENVSSLTERLAPLSLNEGSEQSVLTKLNVSHITLVKEMHSSLKEKLKLLNTLS